MSIENELDGIALVKLVNKQNKEDKKVKKLKQSILDFALDNDPYEFPSADLFEKDIPPKEIAEEYRIVHPNYHGIFVVNKEVIIKVRPAYKEKLFASTYYYYLRPAVDGAMRVYFGNFTYERNTRNFDVYFELEGLYLTKTNHKCTYVSVPCFTNLPIKNVGKYRFKFLFPGLPIIDPTKKHVQWNLPRNLTDYEIKYVVNSLKEYKEKYL